MPDPLTNADRASRVSSDLASLYANQEPVTGAIDIYEAVARGLKYNVDKRLKEFEHSISRRSLRSATLDMLPDFVANAGYSGRNEYRASTSYNLANQNRATGASTSEDRERNTASLGFSWNILDFGVSYYRAKQSADKVLIADERRVKVVQNIVMDIRDAYWRAVAAERVLPQVNAMINRINAATRNSDKAISSGLGQPLKELRFQRTLLQLMSDLVEVRRRLALAKAQLAALINLPPGAAYKVKGPAGHRLLVPRIRADIAELQRAALLNRPELREEDYNGRVSEVDAVIAKLNLLPGIDLNAATSFDSNSFLVDNGWSQASASISKNLMDLVRAPRAIRLAKANAELADVRRQALSMAVLAQLHLSLQRLALATDIFKVSGRTQRVNSRISDILKNQGEALAAAEIEVLEAESNRVISLVRYYAAYADVQNAYGRVLNSLGSHRFPENVKNMDVATLTKALTSKLNIWKAPITELKVSGKTGAH
ncbi:MAG: TolC family protein [Hyphomicrobiales bacterium]